MKKDYIVVNKKCDDGEKHLYLYEADDFRLEIFKENHEVISKVTKINKVGRKMVTAETESNNIYNIYPDWSLSKLK